MTEYNGNPILNSVRQRLWRLNKNWIAACIGDPGSGKSWAAISLADYLEKGKFDICRVYFTVKDIMLDINNDRITKGQVIVFDEAGIAWKARGFMRKENQDMSDLFQIMRYMNFALIMTSPSLEFIDKHGRNLAKMIFIMRSIDRKTQTTKAELMHISYDHLRGKSYPKWPRVIKDGIRYKAAVMHISKPRADLINSYEAKKKAYATELIQEKINRDEIAEAKRNEQLEKREASCDKCNHTWMTASKAVKIHCPSCGNRLKASNPALNTK